MNVSLLSNLTDKELLRMVQPETELEKMLVDRMESGGEDVSEVEALTNECNSLEDEKTELDSEIDTLSNCIQVLLEFLDGEISKEEVEKNSAYEAGMKIARI